MKQSAALRGALRDSKLIIVCGSGGVGKTTTAAALALHAARAGRKTLVATIDPSRRLATSLGLSHLGKKPRAIAPRLRAMRLDPKATFDDVVKRYSPDAATRERILRNGFYQEISSHLVGTHDVMAMEALLALYDEYELVVLDTPPSASALSFLDAPRRMLDFLDARILRLFLRPYFAAGRLALEPKTAIGRTVLSLVNRVIGLQFLRDLSEFFLAFEGLYDAFRRSADKTNEILRTKTTDFVLVAAPNAAQGSEARSFAQALAARGFKSPHLILNRVRETRRLLTSASQLPQAVRDELMTLFEREQKGARSDAREVASWREEPVAGISTVREFDEDVHDLAGLDLVGTHLFGRSAL